MSFSKYNVNCFSDTYTNIQSPNAMRRPRQNSVFVGTSTMAFLNPPRRVKSAIDIQHMIVNENKASIAAFNSMLPIIPHCSSNNSRRPSITIDRPPITTTTPTSHRHRPSINIDRPYLSHYQQFRSRRPSCFLERSVQRHRNFISFEHPYERKKSIAIEKTSYSLQHPTISFETTPPSSVSIEQPTVVVEQPSLSENSTDNTNNTNGERRKSIAAPKMSKSFEQPNTRHFEKSVPPPRLSVSLDVNPISFNRRTSITEEEQEPTITIVLDETQITAPLLESLKSSDV